MEKPKYATLQRVRTADRTYAITPRIPGGFVTPDILEKIAQVAKTYHGTLKITSGQRIMILGLKEADVNKAWEDLGMEPAVLSPYSVKNVEMCPASFCKRSKQNSLKLGMVLDKRFYGVSAPNRTKIGVAGCLNGCTSVHAKDIGVLANETGYIVVAGGSAGYHQRLSDEIARDLSEAEAYDMVESVFEYYCEKAEMGVKLGDYIDSVGIEVFKAGVMDKFAGKRCQQDREAHYDAL